MTDLTRRLFLIGSGATLVAAGVAAEFGLSVVPVQAAHSYEVRKVWSVAAMSLHHIGIADATVFVRLGRGADGPPILQACVNERGGGFYWTAPRGLPIIATAKSPLRVEWIGGSGAPSRIDLTVEDDGVWYLEQHSFPNKGPAKIIALDAVPP